MSSITQAETTTAPPVVARAYITFEEYLERSSETRTNEWVDGEIIEMPGATYEHQSIGSFLETLLRLYVEEKELGIILRSPFAMKLEVQRRGREPDILFVRKENVDRILRTYLDGPCDIAVEIISPESITRDRAEKFVEYETAGVSEYWLIDPERKIAEFYGLSEDGKYSLLSAEEGIFRSRVLPGFFLRVETLWKKNPSSVRALREILA
jgi:Uma2 family endonuclease